MCVRGTRPGTGFASDEGAADYGAGTGSGKGEGGGHLVVMTPLHVVLFEVLERKVLDAEQICLRPRVRRERFVVRHHLRGRRLAVTTG